MRYLSVCSGIEAATVAWHPLGWKAAAFSEIDKFPRAVLQHHYPDVPLHGDFTTIKGNEYGTIDLIIGGTPCQSFSIAGLRKGLDDARGNLSLEFIRLVKRIRPQWVIWENVPGVLSIDRGRAFGAFLAGLGQCGYGFAYRILDAQYFGVPQRRRRVFVIGHFGDWRSAAAVLFEQESLRGNIKASKKKREEAADSVAKCLMANNQRLDPEVETFVIAENIIGRKPENGGNGDGYATNISYTLNATGVHGVIAPTLNCQARGIDASLIADGLHAINHGRARRLTPLECERLQGFPDDYTLIPYGKGMAGDGARYKAIGNSMAAPVINWLGRRIEKVSCEKDKEIS